MLSTSNFFWKIANKFAFSLDYSKFCTISGFAEDTHARKIANKFAFSLAYSYLCPKIERYEDISY